MQNAVVSVCIPTHNGEKYIQEQIYSILPQLSENDEIIISDDGSTDKTLDVINSINDRRIKLFNYRPNQSEVGKSKSLLNVLYKISRNVENALSNASGEYIFLADQDDIWLEEKVGTTMKALQSSDLVICNCIVVDENSKVLNQSYFNIVTPKINLIRTVYKSSYHGCCMAFNRKILKKALPFSTDPIGHDTRIGIVGCLYGKVEFIEQPLLLYRRHGINVSNSAEKSTNSFFFKIRYRLIIVKVILKYLF